MTAMKTDTPMAGDMCRDCPSALTKSGTGCGLRVLYGPTACWRRDGRQDRPAGLSGEGWRSPFEWEEGEVRE